MGGVARRNWARNDNAMQVCRDFNENCRGVGHVTIPYVADDDLVKGIVNEQLKKQ